MIEGPAGAQWLVLGLGNPGEEYVGTRHNVGFEVVDALCRRHGIVLRQRLPSLLYGQGRIVGQEVILGKPRTFMNRSGVAAREGLKRWMLRPEQLLVVLDDVALPLGKIRVRKQGSDGGHKGLRSVLASVGSELVPRIRVGIGQPKHGDIVEFVLSPFSRAERPVIDEAIERAADAVETVLSQGVEVAMNRFNARSAS
ncbi:MAG: aminoacyl-tRNA hydrolase [Candidatus Binatia bacterium]|nr:aminoacyl-tRNA hydrolase [Candidatus Binatia bacterium]